MISYWLLYLAPALASLSPFKCRGAVNVTGWVILICMTGCFIGLRHNIGGDWDNYLYLFFKIEELGLSEALEGRSKGYGLLNWVIAELGFGIHGVNLVCAVIGVVCLWGFCRRQKDPLLAWVIFLPYLVLVVGMGYTRQATAVFLVMLAYVWLIEERRFRFLLLVFLATLFHKSAFVAFPLVLLVLPWRAIIRKVRQRGPFATSSQFWFGLSIVCVMFVVMPTFYWDSVKNYLEYYVYRDQWSSSGATIRVMMNALPAVLILAKWVISQRNYDGEQIHRLWIVLSLAAIASTFLLLISSTVADRMSLYLIALQGFAFSQVPYWTRSPLYHGVLKAGIVAAYGFVLLVWFSFADHAYDWLPYENILFR